MRHLRIMKVPFFLISLFLILGCRSPQQKFDRLVKKYPELLKIKEVTFRDTIEIKGETIINNVPFNYKHITLRFGDNFQFRYDSTGKLIPDSFLFKKEDVKVKLFADSSGLKLEIEYSKKILEPTKSVVRGKTLKSTLTITDSGVIAETEKPDTSMPIEVKGNVETYCNHNILREQIKGAIVGFFAVLIFLMGVVHYGRKRED